MEPTVVDEPKVAAVLSSPGNSVVSDDGHAKENVDQMTAPAAAASKLHGMKVNDLRKLCEDMELPTDGNKAVLVARLQKLAHKLPVTPRRPRSDPGLLGSEPQSGRKSASRLPKLTMRKSGTGQALKEIAA